MTNYHSFLIGLLVLPTIWIAVQLLGILILAIRDTIKWRFKHFVGYSKWIIPALYLAIFWHQFIEQCRAWWGEYDYESDPIEMRRDSR